MNIFKRFIHRIMRAEAIGCGFQEDFVNSLNDEELENFYYDEIF